jgi:hypothetical protein
MNKKKIPKRKITLLNPKQAVELEVQYTHVRAELLKLQHMLEEAGAVPVGGWRPGKPSVIDECDVVCDAECGIVCFQGECCGDDSGCEDSACLDESCADEERFRGPDFYEQILLPNTQIKGVLYSSRKIRKEHAE